MILKRCEDNAWKFRNGLGARETHESRDASETGQMGQEYSRLRNDVRGSVSSV